MTNQVTFLLSFLIAFQAAISDVKSRKVTNKFLLVALVIGVMLRALIIGYSTLNMMHQSDNSFHMFITLIFDEIMDCLLGILIPFIVLLIPYLTRAFGAADIKLLMILGLILGRQKIIAIIIVSIFLGGIIGVFEVIKKLFRKSAIRKIEIPFAVAILIADVAVLLC